VADERKTIGEIDGTLYGTLQNKRDHLEQYGRIKIA